MSSFGTMHPKSPGMQALSVITQSLYCIIYLFTHSAACTGSAKTLSYCMSLGLRLVDLPRI